MKRPSCVWSPPCWRRPAKNGNPEKSTSTWKAKPSPQFELAKFTDKKIAPPGYTAYSGSEARVYKFATSQRHPLVTCVRNAGLANEERIPLIQIGWSSPLGAWLYVGPDISGIYSLSERRPLVRSVMTDWSFYWENNTLYVRLASGVTPLDANITIEASENRPFEVIAPFLHVKGLTVRNSSVVNLIAGWPGFAVGHDSTVEDCVIEWMDCDGLSVQSGSDILNCQVKGSGRTGFEAGGKFTLEGSLSLSNNWRGFAICDHAGGAKFISYGWPNNWPNDYGGTLVANSKFIGNNAVGFWFDTVKYNTSDIVVRDSLFAFNRPGGPFARDSGDCIAGSGIFIENSTRVILYNNVLATNGWAPTGVANNGFGIWLGSSTDCKVIHNTILTGQDDVALIMGTETPYNPNDVRPVPERNEIRNNIFSQTQQQIAFVIELGRTWPPPGNPGSQFINILSSTVLDYNCYYATPALNASGFRVHYFGYPSQDSDIYDTLQGFFSQVRPQGLELQSFEGNPGLTLSLKPSRYSLVVDRATATSPPILYDAAGLPRTVPDIGAYEYDGIDSDSDGFDNNWESFYGIASNDPNFDTDGDGLSNLAEYQRGTNPLVTDTEGVALFVDKVVGLTSLSGLFPWRFSTDHGPKQTINQAVSVARLSSGVGNSDQIKVAAGNYAETVDLRGRKAILYVPSGVINLR